MAIYRSSLDRQKMTQEAIALSTAKKRSLQHLFLSLRYFSFQTANQKFNFF